MNKIILMGRLTKDPEIKYSQGEKPVAIGRVSVAVNKKYKREGGPTADFFNCTAFGRQAEFIEKYLKKGSKVLITARLENNNYEKDGKTVYDNAIIVEEIEFADSKKTDESHSQPESQPQSQPQMTDGFMNMPTGLEEELPFC